MGLRRHLVGAVPAPLRRRRAARASSDALRRVQAIAATPGRIAAGPWTSEVGFELLYWIPFLAWARDELGLDPERVVAVTRGGAGGWYARVAASTADLLQLVAPEELREWQRSRQARAGSQKQSFVSDAERESMRRVGLAGARLLHPSLMYRAFHVGWEQLDQELLTGHLRHEPLPPQADVPTHGIPAGYVAVKLYGSRVFPPTPRNVEIARSLVRALADRAPVVLLRTSTRLDDHVDLGPAVDGVVDAAPLIDPSRNLEAQTALVRSARCLVTTYGGFSYLGPLAGVPTTAVFTQRAFNDVHLRVFDAALERLPSAPRFQLHEIGDTRSGRLAEEILS